MSLDRRNHKRRTSDMSQKDRARRVRAMLKRDGSACHWCAKPFTEVHPPTIDHLVPRIAGGTNALTNLVLACGDCNSKRANPPLGRRRTRADGVVIFEGGATAS